MPAPRYETEEWDSTRCKSLVVNASLLVWTLVILFVLLEVAARYFLFNIGGEERFFRYASINQIRERYPDANHPLFTHSPHRYLGYYPTPNYIDARNRHNSLGFRGEEIVMPKPENEFRIACIGGSTTYGGWIDDHKLTYPAILQDELRKRGYNVTVINAGNEAWTSYESVVNYEFRLAYLDVDLLVVYDAANDLVSRIVWPLKDYRSDNSGFRSANPADVSMPPFYEYSTFVRGMAIKLGFAAPHASLYRTYDSLSPSFRGFLWREMARRNIGTFGIFKTVSVREILEKNPPVYFERNLKHLAALARSDNARIMFATYVFCPDFPEDPWVASPEIQWAYEQMNDSIRKVAGEESAPLYDHSKVFPRDKIYFADGIHVNKVGARMQAEMFAAWMDEQGTIPAEFKSQAVR